MKRVKFFFLLYPLVLIALFFYSFTQVDLSLTLSKSSIYQDFEKSFQYLGFFQRPLSALVFTIILGILFIFYFYFLYLAHKGKVSIRSLKLTVFLTFLILVFSYNAFSYDLFNYIFDAKILTFYHLNPYLHKALDFPNDPMLSFMRWTHRLYPYGPSWLALTVPLSFIGANFFLPTFLLFKIMIGAFFVGSTYLIYKISEIIFPNDKVFNTIFWGLNPLVIIESLISSHNDQPLIFFALLSIYFFIKKKRVLSGISYLFSIGVKFSTAIFFPLFAYLYYADIKKIKIDWEKVFKAASVLAAVAVLVATLRTNFQPWYLLIFLSFASFLSKKYYVFIPAVILSLFASLTYIPYVLLTDYSKDYPAVINRVEIAGVALAVILPLLFFLKLKFVKKH